jgi:PA14 domain
MAFASAGPIKWSDLNCAYGFGSNATFSYSNVRASTEGASYTNISLSNIQNRAIPYPGYMARRKFTETATGTFNDSTEAATRFNNTKGIISYVNNLTVTTEDSICYEWSGSIKLVENGTHTFNVNTDDGGQLEVNGSIVGSYYGAHGTGGAGTSGTISLNAGVYPVRLLLQQGGGAIAAEIWYKAPSAGAFTTINTFGSSNFTYSFKPYIKMDANHLAFGQGVSVNSAISTWSNMGTDGTAVHASGASGNSSGNPTLTSDTNGYMVTFDRTKQQHFSFGTLTFDKFVSSDSLNINGLTILTVVRYSPGNIGNFERVFDFGNGAPNNNILLTRSGTTSTLCLHVIPGTNADGGSPVKNFNYAQLDGAFHVYAVQVANGSPTSTAFFLDGNQVTDGVSDRAGTTAYNMTNRTLSTNYIGRSLFGDAYFNGDIRELQIYREVIPTSVVIQMSKYLMLKWGVRNDTMFITNGLVGYYTGESWTGSAWNDISPSANNVTTIIGTPINNSVTLNGYKCMSGGTSAGMKFLPAITPSGYTLFHVTKYNGSNKGRIFDAFNTNWLSGHHLNKAGVAYHASWMTPETDVHGTNWVLSSDQKDLYRSNGVQRSTTTGVSTDVSMCINFNAELSDWAVACVITYNRTLSGAEIQQMELYLNRKYNIY